MAGKKIKKSVERTFVPTGKSGGKSFFNPLNDRAFRKLVGEEDSEDILISMLNGILELEGDDRVAEIDLQERTLFPDALDQKEGTLDLFCKDFKGEYFIVEVQVRKTDKFEKRMQFYCAKSYADQLKKGIPYSELKKVYMLGILGYDISPTGNYNSDSYKSVHKILDVKNQQQLFCDMEFHIVELRKFNKKENECNKLLDAWLYFLNNARGLNQLPKHVKDQGLSHAYIKMEQQMWSEKEAAAYLNAEIQIQDAKNQISASKAEGLAEGEAIGEKKAAIKFAKKLLEKGFELKEIVDATGLSIEEIKKIK